ncbi:abortive infection family protein [Roseiarcus sp.]|uniref:abortive infection family protein n=1 Tax=Roseiarcus sp. TaxID=1969460 RepID=UPI003C79265B
MEIKLSPQTIEALAFVISGGSANDSTPLIGLYRSGPKLERFMRSCNVDFRIGNSSRLPALTECLIQVARGEDAQALLPRIIEAAADPRDFADAPEKLTSVVDYLNRYLVQDGLALQRRGQSMRLVAAGAHSQVTAELVDKAEVLDFDTVRRDLDRALESAEYDPEDAVTAACSTVESMCRSILLELGLPLPQRKDIGGLYRAVREPLGISPDRSYFAQEIVDDVRKVLSGLATAIEGIGALRTHAGDAHGRERGFKRIDARIARLAIHSASTVALFLLETWQQKHPTKALNRH